MGIMKNKMYMKLGISLYWVDKIPLASVAVLKDIYT